MKSERLEIIDYLKALCIVFVIILHCNKPFQLELDRSPFWVFGFKMAVPLFMMLSGYTAAMSQMLKGNFYEQYRIKVVIKKLLRFTMPIVVCVLFWLLTQYIKGTSLNVELVYNTILFAHFGSGSYYYHLMIQFVFLSPLIVELVRRYEEKGVVAIILTNLLYEIVFHMLGLEEEIYRVLIFRYLAEIVLGAYIFLKKERVKGRTLCMSIILGGVPTFPKIFRL